MKQHLDPKDLDQLTDSGKQKLREWWKPSVGDFFTRQNPSEYYHLLNVKNKQTNRMLQKINDRLGKNYKLRKTDYDETGVSYANPILVANEAHSNKPVKDNQYPLLSLGQLIQFLVENKKATYMYDNCYQQQIFKLDFDRVPDEYHEELCDALWENAKTILNAE